jgi:DNA processing protein
MSNDLLYQIALTLVPNIGSVQAKVLIEYFGDAASIFKASLKQLSAVENIGEVKAKNIKNFNDFALAEKEIQFIEKYAIQPLFMTSGNYPKRLLNSYDAPVLLYYRGNTDLNASRIISIVGTRSNTEYGKGITEKLIADLKAFSPLIASGLAFGIDAIAHKAAYTKRLTNHWCACAWVANHLSCTTQKHGKRNAAQRRAAYRICSWYKARQTQFSPAQPYCSCNCRRHYSSGNSSARR